MQAVIKQLYNILKNKKIFPITKTSAVYDDSGKRLDNILEELQNYSTEETVCGKWLGKPLYQKVVVKEGINRASTQGSFSGTQINLDLPPTDFAFIHETLAKQTNGYISYLPTIYGSPSSNGWYLSSSIKDGILSVYNASTEDAVANAKYYFIVRYTKTTD